MSIYDLREKAYKLHDELGLKRPVLHGTGKTAIQLLINRLEYEISQKNKS